MYEGVCRCENGRCKHTWTSVRAMLVVTVQPHCRLSKRRFAVGWTVTSIEQVMNLLLLIEIITIMS